MKDVIQQLWRASMDSLYSMKKTDMTLTERIKYEVAIAKLQAMKLILDKYNF